MGVAKDHLNKTFGTVYFKLILTANLDFFPPIRNVFYVFFLPKIDNTGYLLACGLKQRATRREYCNTSNNRDKTLLSYKIQERVPPHSKKCLEKMS